ncbi:hypothetical protein IP92_04343 [Pseudoduganella flava]|uniref:Uncharacterized protein n=1 Tax=Pseudoduganella flava TaxID=871742 RepID=A0A562PJ91_9BURK|nr:hypothetical protein [Pseudoduganella flava]QGZ41980.1 hypothetical protein GO485_24965 [Pseudoduganella flava]TWI44393.1 hypothetical protein IP92_04343 [Pseudoduganella flava]
MNKSAAVVAIALAFTTYAQAESKKSWDSTFRLLKGEYLIYGGTLGEAQQPTGNDRKVSLKVTGQVAKDMFDSMYPDEKVTCTDVEGYRERRKGEVFCTYDRQDGYACYFGFDLRTGRSIGGASC